MAVNRDWYINGEGLVSVRGGAHLYSGQGANVTELGLSFDAIKIMPDFEQTEIYTDDVGKKVPIDIMWDGGVVNIEMNLIHYDPVMLDICIAESMGGMDPLQSFGNTRTVGPNGTLLRGNKDLFASGCHLMSLSISSPEALNPYHFLACYLTAPPMKIPLGTDASIVNLQWQSIPYSSGRAPIELVKSRSGHIVTYQVIPAEILSSGRTIWDFKPISNS